jgi:hypothetical protein
MHDRLEQRLLGREVPVQRSRADPGAAGDLIEGDGKAVSGEGDRGDLDEAIPVAAGVGPLGPGCRQGFPRFVAIKRGAVGNV